MESQQYEVEKPYLRHRDQIPRPDTVHRITSFTAWQANPTEILARNRGDREVENRGHYACSLGYKQDTVGIFFAGSGG
ncbi:MAG: hypothetical protein ACXWNR_07530 [Candidatus Limnocylindrales bacterium]